MIDGLTSGTMKAGEVFQLAGNTQLYTTTADATVSGGTFTLQISPPAVQAYGDGVVFSLGGVVQEGFDANLIFAENAFAFASAPLPSAVPQNLGARVETVTDPFTGLSLRARLWYEPNDSEIRVALDILYGVKTIDPNFAGIIRTNIT